MNTTLYKHEYNKHRPWVVREEKDGGQAFSFRLQREKCEKREGHRRVILANVADPLCQQVASFQRGRPLDQADSGRRLEGSGQVFKRNSQTEWAPQITSEAGRGVSSHLDCLYLGHEGWRRLQRGRVCGCWLQEGFVLNLASSKKGT